MKFLYFLDNSAGWAGVIFEHEKISLNYSVSYCLSENIKQLLGGILVLTEQGMEIIQEFIMMRIIIWILTKRILYGKLTKKDPK
jgi:hypothetical protein